jgi:hypothetical protein
MFCANLGLAVWAAAPPYVGPSLDTARRVEVGDHVVPAAVVATASVAAVVIAARSCSRPVALLVCGLSIWLAGLWMTVTHVPLVGQATRGQAPWGSVIHHLAPCVVVLAFGSVCVRTLWSDLVSVVPSPQGVHGD